MLVCAVDYFRKYQKMWNMSFKKNKKKKPINIVHKQKGLVHEGVKSAL